MDERILFFFGSFPGGRSSGDVFFWLEGFFGVFLLKLP